MEKEANFLSNIITRVDFVCLGAVRLILEQFGKYG